MRIRRKPLPASLMLLGATMAAANAQDTQTDTDIDEVIVRSSPLRTSVNEIVLGTTVVDRDEIVRDLDYTIGQTLARQPGVSSTFFGPGASRPIIRGLGGDRIRILTNDISAFDVSTSSGDHLVATEVGTAQSIEIIRGASTLRFGQNAVGGIVNVYDNRIARSLPEGGYDLEFNAAHSTVDDGNIIGGSADFALGENFVFHLDGSDRESKDYEVPGFASEEAEEEGLENLVENSKSLATSATAGLSWVGEKGYLGFAVGFQEGKYGLPGGKKEEEEEEGEDIDGFVTAFAEGDEEGGITIDFEQVRFDIDGEYNFDSGIIETAKFRFGLADYEHTEFAGDEPETLFTNDEWEMRAEAFLGDFDYGRGVATGTIGFTLADREFEADGDEAFIPLNEQSKWGIFGLGRYTFDNYILEASARIDGQENETTNLAFEGGSFSDDRTTFSAAFTGIYQLDDTSSIGLNFARSERAPTAEELFSNGFHPATSAVEIGDVNLDTEVANSIEFSYQKDIGALGFGANVYFIDYTDFIFLSPTGDFFEEGEPFPFDEGFPVFAYQQANAELWGFEMEVDYLAVDQGDVRVTLDGQVDLARGESTEATSFGGIDNVRGEFSPLGGNATTVDAGDLPFFPPVRFLGGINIDYEPMNASLRFEVQYVADQNRVGVNPEGSEVDIPGSTPTDNFTFFNVYFDIAPIQSAENVTFSLRARNLTNEFARSATSFLAQSAPLPGRDIRFGVNVQF